MHNNYLKLWLSYIDGTSTSSSKLKESKVDGPLKTLKEQLHTVQTIPCESDDLKESRKKMTESALKNFISTSLDMGADADAVHKALYDVYVRDIILDDEIYQWCKMEIEMQNKIHNPDSLSLQDIRTQPFNEVNFTKEVVQNSIFACHLLEHPTTGTATLTYPHSLFEVNKSNFLRFDYKTSSRHKSCDQESLSTEKVAGHQYLIAKGSVKPSGHVFYYIAFRSHQSLREWSDGHTSFEKGE